MNVDPKLDRFGGMVSLLAGLVCALFAYTDWQTRQSIWKVWVGMCVLLILNGLAMFLHANRTSTTRQAGTVVS
jgi:uncharacterized protein YjeT (DUF2065 family)